MLYGATVVYQQHQQRYEYDVVQNRNYVKQRS